MQGPHWPLSKKGKEGDCRDSLPHQSISHKRTNQPVITLNSPKSVKGNENKKNTTGSRKFELLHFLRLKHNIDKLKKVVLGNRSKIDIGPFPATEEAHIIPRVLKSAFSDAKMCAAAKAGDTAFIHVAITQHGNDPNCRDPYTFRHLIHLSCLGGHLNLVKYLIREAGIDPECQDASKSTPLLYAIRGGHSKVIKYLVSDIHVSMTQVDKNGCGILHIACRYEHLNIVKYFINIQRAKARIMAQRAAETAISAALFAKTVSMSSSLFISQHYVRTKIDTVNPKANANSNFSVQRFTQSKPDVDRNGWSPLHWACKKGNISIAKYLIEKVNARLDLRDISGNTLLHHIVRLKNTSLLMYSIHLPCRINNHEEESASWIQQIINVKNHAGFTALQIAVRCKNIAAARILIKEGAEINTITKQGDNLITLAATYGDYDLLKDISDLMKPLGDVVIPNVWGEEVENNAQYTAKRRETLRDKKHSKWNRDDDFKFFGDKIKRGNKSRTELSKSYGKLNHQQWVRETIRQRTKKEKKSGRSHEARITSFSDWPV